MERIPAPGDLYRHVTDKIYQVIAVAVHAESGEQMIVYQAMFGDFGIFTMPLARFLGSTGSRQHLFEKIERTGIPYQQPEQTAADMNRCKPETDGTNVRQYRTETAAEKAQQYRTETAAEKTQQYRTETAAEKAQQYRIETAAEQDSAADDTRQQVSNTVRQQSHVRERPHVQRPADSRRMFSQDPPEASGGAYYEKRQRQMEEREQRRGMFRKTERHETATEELHANPCLLKFLEADTYEERFHVLNQIQDEITDRLIDDMAVVLDVVIPEGSLSDRFHQLRDVILTRQKYETNRFR